MAGNDLVTWSCTGSISVLTVLFKAKRKEKKKKKAIMCTD